MKYPGRCMFQTISSSILVLTVIILVLSPSEATQNNGTIPGGASARIIGGQPSMEGRYNFVASLVKAGTSFHFCGGSVIAPDLVITAAHCAQEGTGGVDVDLLRYNLLDPTDAFERISVVRQIPHPLYVNGDSLRYDFMVMQLSQTTSALPVRVNLDASLPQSQQDVTTLGWGLTNTLDSNSLSPVLQETTDLTVVSNDACEKSKDPASPWASYRGQIYDDMLCAWGSGQDSCQGDSGGPLIMTQDDDLLVGIVSWGYDCADQYFPGVYSRPSYVADWLKTTVCDLSQSPPSYFNCSHNSPTSDITPTPSPSAQQPVGSLQATLSLQMDGYPKDVGWRVEHIEETTETVVARTPGVYSQPGEFIQEVFWLQEGEIYSFVIFDVTGDGIDGSITLALGSNEERTLIQNDGSFGGGLDLTFIATLDDSAVQPPTLPVASGNFFLELEIVFDLFPDEIGWILKRNGDTAFGRESEIIAFMPVTSYSRDLANQKIVERIPLAEEGSFTFHFLDAFADGLCCQYGNGWYRLYEGMSDDNILLASGNAAGTSRESTTFEISLPALQTEQPTLRPSEQPTDSAVPPTDSTTPPELTISPEASPAETSEKVSIFIRPDNSPRDIGWRIVDNEGRILVSKSEESYTSIQDITESVDLGYDSAYTFTILDAGRDGICCGSDRNGYYTVDTSNGLVAFGSSFSDREDTAFVTPGELPVQLNLKTDQYPQEIQWKLERLDLDRIAVVAALPLGFYDTPGQTVQQQFMVSPDGFYRFTIRDKEGDAICCKYGQGAVSLSVGDNEQRLIVDELGQYGEAGYYTFYGSTSEQPQFDSSNTRQLELTISFDRYPREVSWILMQDEADTSTSVSRVVGRRKVAAYGPKEAYYKSNAGSTVTETIAIELIPEGTVRGFTFVVFDAASDGLCCEYGSGSYRLFEGNETILNGAIYGGDREEQVFSLSHDGIVSKPPVIEVLLSGAATCTKSFALLVSLLFFSVLLIWLEL